MCLGSWLIRACVAAVGADIVMSSGSQLEDQERKIKVIISTANNNEMFQS